MRRTYEVWDAKSGNAVGMYKTLREALAVADKDPENLDVLAVDEDETAEAIAEAREHDRLQKEESGEQGRD